jgi:hypothetical protein
MSETSEQAEQLRQELYDWTETALNVFLAPDGLVATPETVEQFTQILEAHAKEFAAAQLECRTCCQAQPSLPPERAALVERLEFLADLFNTRMVTARSADDSARPALEVDMPKRELDAAMSAMREAAAALRGETGDGHGQ